MASRSPVSPEKLDTSPSRGWGRERDDGEYCGVCQATGSVTSNERQPDTDVAHDIKGFTVGTPSTSGLLRAERSFRDRVYTLVYTGSDVAGNRASCTVVVKVARHHDEDHDRDHDKDHHTEDR
jgi:hypothetical protein